MTQPTHALVVFSLPKHKDLSDDMGALRDFEKRAREHGWLDTPESKLNPCTYLLSLDNGLRPLLALVAAAGDLAGCVAHVSFFEQKPKFLPLIPKS